MRQGFPGAYVAREVCGGAQAMEGAEARVCSCPSAAGPGVLSSLWTLLHL